MRKSCFFRRLGRGVLILGAIGFVLIYIRLVDLEGPGALVPDLTMALAALICLVPGYLLLRVACLIRRFEEGAD